MEKIKGIEIYRWYDDKTFYIDISEHLTTIIGYNGCGKTWILSVINTALHYMYTENEYFSEKSNWACKINLLNGKSAIVFNCLFNARNIDLEEDDKKNQEFFEENTLKDSFLYLKNKYYMTNINNDNYKLSMKREMSHVLIAYGEIKSVKRAVKFYKDDIITSDIHKVFNEKYEDLDEFSNHSLLDKSLYALLPIFYSRLIESKNFVPFSKKKDLEAILGKANNFLDNKEKRFFENFIKNRIYFDKENIDILKIINSFFRETNKKIEICKDTYVKFNNSNVPWVEFSKGEKILIQILINVYLYKENTLFIFDEPDTCFHIDWQEKLMKKLVEIAPNSQFIIATHSPAIIKTVDDEIIYDASIQKRVM